MILIRGILAALFRLLYRNATLMLAKQLCTKIYRIIANLVVSRIIVKSLLMMSILEPNEVFEVSATLGGYINIPCVSFYTNMVDAYAMIDVSNIGKPQAFICSDNDRLLSGLQID